MPRTEKDGEKTGDISEHADLHSLFVRLAITK
jgi:hypothetical protein